MTVLVDGRPSSLFSGPQRADALQQQPADQYDRVEVMTNPSAAFKSEGTGGVINLITKKASSRTSTVSMKVNLGTERRGNIGLNANWHKDKLSIAGSSTLRFDRVDSDQTSVRDEYGTPPTMSSPQSLVSEQRGTSRVLTARGSLDYDLDAKDRLSAAAFAFDTLISSKGSGEFAGDVLGASGIGYHQSIRSSSYLTGGGASATWLRRLSKAGNEILVDLSADESDVNVGRTSDYLFEGLSEVPLYQLSHSQSTLRNFQLKVEHKKTFGLKGKMALGYELSVQDGIFNREGLLGPTAVSAVPIAGLNSRFGASRTIQSLYLTLEQSLGKLTFLPGIRIETSSTEASVPTTQSTRSLDTADVNPTLHVAYSATELQSVTASFGRRVNRPSLQSLNPSLVYISPVSSFAGNSGLGASHTESYEFAWEYQKGQTNRQATVFFRDNHDVLQAVTRDLGGGVLLDTQANIASIRDFGVELVAGGRFPIKTLAYNASLTAIARQIAPGSSSFTSKRSDTSARGRVSLNWDMTSDDFFQVTVNAVGRQLTAQGFTRSGTLLNLGFRHRFSDRFTLLATANDVFSQARTTQVVDSLALRERTVTSPRQKTFYLGMVFNFDPSAKRRAPDQFDFSSGPTPIPQL